MGGVLWVKGLPFSKCFIDQQFSFLDSRISHCSESEGESNQVREMPNQRILSPLNLKVVLKELVLFPDVRTNSDLGPPQSDSGT